MADSESNPNSFVTLIAGQDDNSKSCGVHKDFACHYSPVLKAAFASSFVEGQTQTYKLPDATEEATALLVHWFYTQELLVDALEKDENDPLESLRMAQLWVLADQLLVPRLQNTAIRAIVQLRSRFKIVPTRSIAYVYRHTAAGSSLRKLMVQLCAGYLKAEWIAINPDQFPAEMLLDFAIFACNDARTEMQKKVEFEINSGAFEVSEESNT